MHELILYDESCLVTWPNTQWQVITTGKFCFREASLKQLKYSMALNFKITSRRLMIFCTFKARRQKTVCFMQNNYLHYLCQPLHRWVASIRYKPLWLADCSVVPKPPVALKQSLVHFLNLSKQRSTTRWLIVCKVQAICVHNNRISLWTITPSLVL